MTRFVVALLLSLAPLAQAYAQAVAAPTAFDQFMHKVTGAGKQTVDFGKDGTPVVGAGVPTVNTDGGLPRVDTSGSIRNPSGNPVPVSATARVPSAEVAKAAGRAAVNIGTKLAVVVGVGLTLYDLAKEIGHILSREPDGSIKVTKPDPTVCTVAPCYQYAAGGYPWRSSVLAACQDWASTYNGNPVPNASFYYTNIYVTSSTGSGGWGGVCSADLHYSSNGQYATTNTSQSYRQSTPAVAPVYLPSTMQELQDAIAAKSGWPSGSAVRRLLAEDYPAPADRVRPIGTTVSGPSSSAGTSSQSAKPNGNTETKTVTHNHTYNGNTVTTTTSTVINNYNPTTNVTETETTTETPAPEPDDNVTDAPLPALPKLYEPKYPDGLVGVWAQKKAQLLATPLASVLPQLMPSVADGGSCPSWMLNLSLGHWDYGSHDVAPPCYIWDWCKFFIIAGALLLARALIFGG